MKYEIKRGDVVVVRLTGAEGSEQKSEDGWRPCLVVQNDVGNTNAGSKTTIIVPITDPEAYRNIPVQVRIYPVDWDQALEAGSVVECGQVRTVDEKRIKEPGAVGSVGENAMKRVDVALKISLGLVEV